MEKVPDLLGYLVLTEDGAVLESGGELENDERIASIITELVTLSNRIDPVAYSANEPFKKISITYDDHCFIICLSEKKINIVKRSIPKFNIDSHTVNA